MPAFWLGVLLMLLLGLKVPLFPVSGYGDGLLDRLRHLVPAGAGDRARHRGAHHPQPAQQPHRGAFGRIRRYRARPKACARARCCCRHILRNSLISTVSVLSVHTSWVIGGTVVIEAVFALPGLGHLLVTSISAATIRSSRA